MTDSRHSESPSSPPNHSSVSGTGTTNVMNVPAGSQYEAHIPFLMSHSSSRFIPPLNMAPIFPPGMKPPGKPIGVSSSTDLGPPMFQIPLNLGPPSSGLQKHPQVASSMISPASLPSMTPVFLSGAAAPTPQMYNPVHTSMSRPFMMPFQAHIPAGLNPTLSSLDANTPKTKNKLMTGTLSLSPSPPLQPTGKKHPSKVASRVSSSTSSQKISTLSTHSTTDGGNSVVQNEAPTNSFVGNNTQVDDKSESATKTNALHEVHHPQETKVAGSVKGYVKNTNSVDHNSSYRISANSNSMQNEDEDFEEGKPGTECGALVGTRTSEASKFDPNQLLSYYNNIKKEPVHTKDRELHESKETVRKTVGLPSDGSASSTRHTWSTDETRNTNTNVQSDPTAPSLPTNSGVNRSVSTMGQSSQVVKQHTSFDSVTEVDKGTTPTHPQTHRPAVVSTPASTSAGHPLLPTKPASVNSPNTSVAALPLNSSKLPHPTSFPTTPSSLGTMTSTAGNSVVGPPPSTPSNTFTVPHSPRPSTSQATTALSPVSTPPRPSILRKRTNDKRTEPLSPISIRQNLMSAPTLVDQIRSGSESNLSSNEASEVMSPRKKPRKQNMMTTDDQFASAIPECPMDGVSSLTCNNEDVPPSPDCSRSPSPGDTHCLEGKDKTCVSQPVFRRDGDFESSLRLLAELKRPPVLGGYRVNSKATQNHFWRYSDFKVKEQSKPSVMSIAQKKNIRLRVKGWRVGRVNDHMDTMVSNEEDILRTLTTTQECLKKLLEESTSESSSPSVASSQERSSSGSLLEMVQGNFDRSRNIITCIRQTQSVLGKILHHKSKALDLVQKCAPDSFSLETVINRSHNFTRQ